MQLSTCSIAAAAVNASAELPPNAAYFVHTHVDLVDHRKSVAGIMEWFQFSPMVSPLLSPALSTLSTASQHAATRTTLSLSN
jgi:hypothetical protein